MEAGGQARIAEVLRASNEMVAVAFAEGIYGAQLAMLKWSLLFWPEILSGRSHRSARLALGSEEFPPPIAETSALRVGAADVMRLADAANHIR